MPISFFQQSGEVFHVKQKTVLKQLIKQLVETHDYKLKDVNIILMSDEDLLNLNREHLHHDYYTDIITFNYNEDVSLSGDLFISIDRVKENADKFAAQIESELHRVIIHGVLHLVGFNDKSPQDQIEMTEQENVWLTQLSKMFHVKQK